MKRHEQVAIESEVCAGVLGRGDDFLLVRLDKDYPGTQEAVDCAIARGLFYCGTLGWNGSKMSYALEPDPETLKPLRLAVLSFGVLVERMTAPAVPAPETVRGDAVGWLERLRLLPDTRTQV